LTRVLITGITGQDGSYLAKFLLEKGHKVFGTYRRSSSPNFWRLNYLGINEKIKLIQADMLDSSSLRNALEISNPSEVYNLAAQSFVGTSFIQPNYTLQVTGMGPILLLNEILSFNNKIKFYQASSSEMFGNTLTKKQNEKSPFEPVSPYALAKLTAFHGSKIYRKSHDMFAVNGILFNHESPLRGIEFVTRKITNEVAKISLGMSKKISLGNLNAKRDWGYAPEYVSTMWKMLQQKKPDDYVISTGKSHSVLEFVTLACKIAGIPTKCVESNSLNFRPNEIDSLQGDSKFASTKLKWKPKISFEKLVKIMVEEDMERWGRWLKKETFPWDIIPNKS
jgi:GDPmannose 4,6-dehydratase